MSSTVSSATPSTPDLAERPVVIGVEAHQSRHVERRREAGLAVVEQVAEALVGLLDRPEARELAHRPEAAAVHRRIDAAGVGERAGEALVPLAVVIGQIVRRVERLDRVARERLERGRPARAPSRIPPRATDGLGVRIRVRSPCAQGYL